MSRAHWDLDRQVRTGQLRHISIRSDGCTGKKQPPYIDHNVRSSPMFRATVTIYVILIVLVVLEYYIAI